MNPSHSQPQDQTNMSGSQTNLNFSHNISIIRGIGSGKCSDVYLGKSDALSHTVAIKIFRSHDSNSDEQFRNEFTALSLLKNANQINFLASLDNIYAHSSDVKGPTTPDILFLEYFENGELFEAIRQEHLTELIARSYFVQLLSALKSCHDLGIYHRDIKPENIMLDENFSLRLIDFSHCYVRSLHLASPSASHKSHPTFSIPPDTLPIDPLLFDSVGTLSFMSPESLQQLPYLGSQADLWSATCVLFSMLFGHSPFESAESSDWWFHKVQSNDWPSFWEAHLLNPSIDTSFLPSLEFRELIQSCLNPIPSRRLTLSQMLTHPWVKNYPVLTQEELQEIMQLRANTKKKLSQSPSSSSSSSSSSFSVDASMLDFASEQLRKYFTLRQPPSLPPHPVSPMSMDPLPPNYMNLSIRVPSPFSSPTNCDSSSFSVSAAFTSSPSSFSSKYDHSSFNFPSTPSTPLMSPSSSFRFSLSRPEDLDFLSFASSALSTSSSVSVMESTSSASHSFAPLVVDPPFECESKEWKKKRVSSSNSDLPLPPSDMDSPLCPSPSHPLFDSDLNSLSRSSPSSMSGASRPSSSDLHPSFCGYEETKASPPSPADPRLLCPASGFRSLSLSCPFQHQSSPLSSDPLPISHSLIETTPSPSSALDSSSQMMSISLSTSMVPPKRILRCSPRRTLLHSPRISSTSITIPSPIVDNLSKQQQKSSSSSSSSPSSISIHSFSSSISSPKRRHKRHYPSSSLDQSQRPMDDDRYQEEENSDPKKKEQSEQEEETFDFKSFPSSDFHDQ